MALVHLVRLVFVAFVLALAVTACGGSSGLTGPEPDPTPTPDPAFVAAPGSGIVDSSIGPPSEVGDLGFILTGTDLTLYVLETTEEAEVGPIEAGGTYELGGWTAEVTYLLPGVHMKVIVTDPTGTAIP